MAIRRRLFLKISGSALLAGCVPNSPIRSLADRGDDAEAAPDARNAGMAERKDASAPPNASPDASAPPSEDAGELDAGSLDTGVCDRFVTMHDTYAQALYLDGSLGPLTGIIYVDYVLQNAEIELDFWHGHGGVLHRFTLLPEHFDRLKQGERVTLTTTIVEDHQHELFIDPLDPSYEVPGSAEVQVPLC